jgi:hypothetical protein
MTFINYKSRLLSFFLIITLIFPIFTFIPNFNFLSIQAKALQAKTYDNGDTVLDVPYINQCLGTSDTDDYSPSDLGAVDKVTGIRRRICQNMCGPSSSLMLLAAYGLVNYDNNNP